MAARAGIFRLVLVLALSGCTSPTLPLPPPSQPSITTGMRSDTVHLASMNGAEPNAVIIVINRATDLARDERVSGTFADEQGSWELDVKARPGDVLDISQESGATRSPATTLTVH